MKRAAALLLLPLAIAGCGLERLMNDDASAFAALEATQASVLDAVVRKDPAPIVALLADSAIAHLPGGTTLIGKEAIASHITGFLPHVKAYSFGSRHLEASGDLAYDEGTYQLTLEPTGGGELQQLLGFVQLVMKRQPDRTWRLIEIGGWTSAPPEMDHDMGSMPGM